MERISAELHFDLTDSKHGVGLVCLVEQVVQLGPAEAEFSRGSAFGFELSCLDPAADCGR